MQLPARPDQPAPTVPKFKWGKLVVAVLGLMFAVSLLLNHGSDSSTTTIDPISSSPIGTTSGTQSDEALAKVAVDTMTPGQIANFCSSYDVLGEAAFPIFEKAFLKAAPGNTASLARAGFDELASRC